MNSVIIKNWKTYFFCCECGSKATEALSCPSCNAWFGAAVTCWWIMSGHAENDTTVSKEVTGRRKEIIETYCAECPFLWTCLTLPVKEDTFSLVEHIWKT